MRDVCACMCAFQFRSTDWATITKLLSSTPAPPSVTKHEVERRANPSWAGILNVSVHVMQTGIHSSGYFYVWDILSHIFEVSSYLTETQKPKLLMSKLFGEPRLKSATFFYLCHVWCSLCRGAPQGFGLLPKACHLSRLPLLRRLHG